MTVLDLREAAKRLAPAVQAGAELRLAAVATWRGRMMNEYASSSVFASLASQLDAAKAPVDEVRSCREFATEEKNHGVLCGAAVEALGGEAIGTLPVEAEFPLHDDVEPLEGALRNVLSVGCLSETIAVSLIGAEREEMPAGELRDLLTRIWADEIGHARFGWRFVARELPKLDAAARFRVSAYLRVALRHLEQHELSHLPPTDGFGQPGVELGLCSGNDARKLFYATVETVILPRLTALGLDAARAWRLRVSSLDT